MKDLSSNILLDGMRLKASNPFHICYLASIYPLGVPTREHELSRMY